MMKGLILKDLYCLRKNSKSLVFVLIIWGIVFFPQKNGSLGLISLSLLLGMMQTLTLASYDKQAQWDTYALSLPLTRSVMVREKYVMSVLILIMSAAISTALVTVSWIIRSGGLSASFIISMASTLFLGSSCALFYASLSIPLILRLGVEKARYVAIAFIAAFVFLGFVLIQLNNSLGLWNISLTEANLAIFIIWAVIISIALFVASYFISISIYKKRDL